MELLEDLLTFWGDLVGNVLTDWMFTPFGLGWLCLMGALASGVLGGPVLLTATLGLSSAGSWMYVCPAASAKLGTFFNPNWGY